MRAIQVFEHGSASALSYQTNVVKPTPKSGQLLVRNAFSGVNFIDVYHRTGLYPLPLPLIPGREGSGIVEALGNETESRFKVGDRVIYFSPGSYAEFTCTNADRTIKLPDSISLEQGACLNVAGITSLMLAQEIYRVKKDEYVLVHAAAGGVGQALCQLCSHFGAIVIGTTSSQEKAKIAKECGAKHVIIYTEENVSEKVMEITQNAGCKVVYDGVGKSTFEASLASLGTRGYLICFGNASGKPDPFDITRLTKGSKILCRPTMADFIKTPEDYQRLMQQLFDLIEKGVLNIKVTKSYELEDAQKAHEDLEGRKTTSKIALKIND